MACLFYIVREPFFIAQKYRQQSAAGQAQNSLSWPYCLGYLIGMSWRVPSRMNSRRSFLNFSGRKYPFFATWTPLLLLFFDIYFIKKQHIKQICYALPNLVKHCLVANRCNICLQRHRVWLAQTKNPVWLDSNPNQTGRFCQHSRCCLASGFQPLLAGHEDKTKVFMRFCILVHRNIKMLLKLPKKRIQARP